MRGLLGSRAWRNPTWTGQRRLHRRTAATAPEPPPPKALKGPSQEAPCVASSKKTHVLSAWLLLKSSEQSEHKEKEPRGQRRGARSERQSPVLDELLPALVEGRGLPKNWMRLALARPALSPSPPGPPQPAGADLQGSRLVPVGGTRFTDLCRSSLATWLSRHGPPSDLSSPSQ